LQVEFLEYFYVIIFFGGEVVPGEYVIPASARAAQFMSRENIGLGLHFVKLFKGIIFILFLNAINHFPRPKW
jgi:hypothetical protein